MAINFSRSTSQIIGQYYNFVRFGFDGYKEIQKRTHDVAVFLSDQISQLGHFEIVNDGSELPIVCYKHQQGDDVEWTLHDLADRLRANEGLASTGLPIAKELRQYRSSTDRLSGRLRDEHGP